MGRRFADVQPVIAHIADHREETLTLGSIAARAGGSKFHLQRVFAAMVGESPKQLTIRLRLERAAARLLATNDSMLDLALDCGFQSHAVFCRAFRQRFGLTPSAYRRRGLTTTNPAQHIALVEKIGPCVGLYHIPENGLSMTGSTDYEIKKVDLKGQPVLVIRKRVKQDGIAAAIGECLPRIFLYAQQHGLALAGPPITRYTSMGPGLLSLEPGFPVVVADRTELPPDPEIVLDQLPAGPAVTTTHRGHYEKLQNAYGAIEEWIEAQKLERAGAPWEVYITDPGEVPDPKDWITEVCWPVTS